MTITARTEGRKKNIFQQESPPTWTQEAYCLPCSDYSFCCPILADPLQLDWPPPRWTWLPPPTGWTWPPPGQLDLTPPSWIDLWPDPPGWIDLWLDTTTPLAGLTFDLTPPAGPDPPPWLDWPLTWPPLWTDRIVDGQTRVKTLPSPILRMRVVKTYRNQEDLLQISP